MSRTGATWLLTFLLLCGLALSAQTAPAGPPSAAQPSQAAPAPAQNDSPAAEMTPQQQAHMTIEKLSSELNLTADQKPKLETILTGEIQQVRDLRADNSMTVEQKQAKFKDTLTADHAKIDAILTPEQKTKLTQLNQQQHAAQQGQAPSQGQPPAQSQSTNPAPQAAPQTPKP